MENKKSQILDHILALWSRPEWAERPADPERAKVDLILLALAGQPITLAGLARRWGMPRTTARRTVQAAVALVPWLAGALDMGVDSPPDCPKSDQKSGQHPPQMDSPADRGVDTMPDSQNREAEPAQALEADRVVDTKMATKMDSPPDCPKSDQKSGQHPPQMDSPADRGADTTVDCPPDCPRRQPDEIDPADLDELASLPTPFIFDDNQSESLNKPQKTMSPLEMRARKIAEKECPMDQDFEVFFEQNRLRFFVAARA